jgi:hypothetical protein
VRAMGYTSEVRSLCSVLPFFLSLPCSLSFVLVDRFLAYSWFEADSTLLNNRRSI